jgi:hypothetical protein
MSFKSINIARMMLLAIPLWALCASGCSDGSGSEPGSGSGSSPFGDSLLGANGVVYNGMTLNGMTLNGVTLNGMTLNGMTLNGVALNGVSFNGMTLNGVSLNGVSFNGMTLNGMTLNGMTLNGIKLDGTLFSVNIGSQPISGQAFIGTTWNLSIQSSTLAQPLPVTLRFDNIYVDPRSPSGDVYLYDISYSVNGSPQWTSLCSDASGRPVSVVPLRNHWDYQTGARIDDPSAVTFACINAALGKCVRLGYRPWATATHCKGSCESVSLADHHQACTRLLRADYCGNGTSYTENGTLIEVYDDLMPTINANTMSWDLEAQWNPDGARCLGDARHAELLARGRYPNCSGTSRPTHLPNCGNRHSLSQALLASTFQ